MSLASRVPFMEEGSTARNAIVALGYLLLSPILLVIALFSLPFVAAYKVYTGDWSEKLSRLPGIEPGGGAVPAAVAFVYAFVLVGSVVAIAPGGDTGDSPEAAGAVEGTPTVQERRTADATDTPAQTDGGADVTATDSPIATATEPPTASPSPTTSPSPTASPSPTPRQVMSDDEARAVFKTRLQTEIDRRESVAMTIESVDVGGDSWHLSYTTYSTTQQGHLNDIGAIAGGYAGFIDRDDVDAPDRMLVTVYAIDGSKIGTWRVETEWAMDYRNGGITSNEYLRKVLDTLEAEE